MDNVAEVFGSARGTGPFPVLSLSIADGGGEELRGTGNDVRSYYFSSRAVYSKSMSLENFQTCFWNALTVSQILEFRHWCFF